jgi:hypothetical protein
MNTKQTFKIMGLMLAAALLPATGAFAQSYHRLTELPDPKIVAHAEEFPGGYSVKNMLQKPWKRDLQQEFASHSKGTGTFVDFDFSKPVKVAAFRHMQRSTIDTVAKAQLIFSGDKEFANVLKTVDVKHLEMANGVTFAAFPAVEARYVRWQVTSITPNSPKNVGGKGIEFLTIGEAESAPQGVEISAQTQQVIDRDGDKYFQPLKITVDYPYAESVQSVVRVEGQEPKTVDLKYGALVLDFKTAALDAERKLAVDIEIDGQKAAAKAVTVKPARKLTVYILPHSHTDIGYTAIQTDIEEKQINNLIQGIADARRTASYPEGARFKWNVEVAWAADLFLDRLSAAQKADFLDAVKNGLVTLNGMYLNELTGLCRPEELLRLFRYATELADRTGATVDSAMISDVPGYTWGTVSAMAQAGIRYFSVAPNYFDRIGSILVEWENKPFWWVGPDGKSKVLVWIPFWGYAMSHRYGKMSRQLVEDFCDGLEKKSYPYDIAYVRWAGSGDNAVPDPSICEFVKDWNAAHAWPRFIISGTGEAFGAFEKRYGDKIPTVSGDWTPYWEDGAGSSSAETTMNRASSERLSQAEALFAMINPAQYPLKSFKEAWNNVLLYSEHTWGAYCSISEPANPFTMDQWTIKQSYATVANLQSRQLLNQAALSKPSAGTEPAKAAKKELFVDVYNTSSWSRNEIVCMPNELSEGANFVADDKGRLMPSQRLASRELAILVNDLKPFSGQRYALHGKLPTGAQKPEFSPAKASAETATLDNGLIRVRLDPKTGGIVELFAKGIDKNLADTASGHHLNDYLYMIGDDNTKLQRNGQVKITVRDNGPLVASLWVESEAPGCHKLIREIRIVANGDYVEMINSVDKKRIASGNYYSFEGKESVNFAFPFNVPGGDVRLDIPLGIMDVEKDQMPSACKNWLTVGRWADVANDEFGVTWVSMDAPLVQVGGVTANLLNSQTNPEVWRKKVEPTQKLYSWAMNNHWGTNYRAYQEGPNLFRFVIRPHRGRNDADNSRFACNFSQPLVAVPGRGRAPQSASLVSIEPADVLAIALKPSDDGKALILRLFGAGAQTADAKVSWLQNGATDMWLSDTSEKPLRKLTGAIPVPSHGITTIRAELNK